MAKQQKHQAFFKVNRNLELPQYEKGGIEIEMQADGKKVGELIVSGAHVYFKPSRGKWKTWNFTEFARIMKEADSQY